MADQVELHGWTAVVRDSKILLAPLQDKSTPLPLSSLPFPTSALVSRVDAYAKEKLPPGTYNHSMRVYHYGSAIRQQYFPEWKLSDETYALACLLHDIGTTSSNIRSSLMSFEFSGAIVALDLLQKELNAPKVQAEAVAECIIRHQDIGEKGKITTLGQLIQLATIFDNVGLNEHLVHPDTIKAVTDQFPRNKWSSCFAATLKEEITLKPWAHTTALGEDDFPNGVLNNKLMQPYD
ncbi:MAG: hypothetical protein M1825_004783 [Sarcosagium campestre]|nr:MAG: hypothetical protein M1825_004783 [Sarcosagium campestre]